jgi:hypothetical protein
MCVMVGRINGRPERQFVSDIESIRRKWKFIADEDFK